MIKDEHNENVIKAIKNSDKETFFFHGCNAKGVMGAGVAKLVRDNWPDVFEVYNSVCRKSNENELTGKIVPVHRDGIWFINGITQKGFGSPLQGGTFAQPKWIEQCIAKIDSKFEDIDNPYPRFTSVRVGCGLGGLDWEQDVKAIFEKSKLPWEIYYL